MDEITIPLGKKIIFETDDPNVVYTQEGYTGGLVYAKEVKISDDTTSETVTQPDMTQYQVLTRTIVTHRQIGGGTSDYTI